MNALEDSDISFRHDFDPVSIKCEILDEMTIDDVHEDKIKHELILGYESSEEDASWTMDAVLVKEEASDLGNHFIAEPEIKQMETQTQVREREREREREYVLSVL
jgi:hypothetical protein